MESRRPRAEGPAGWALALAASAALHGGLALALFAPGGPPAPPSRLVPFQLSVVAAEPKAPGGSPPRARGAAPPPAAPTTARPAPPPAPAVAERPAEGPPGAEAAGGGAAEEEPSGGAASAGAPGGTVTEYGGAAGPGTGRTPDDAWLLAELHARLRQAAVRCAPAAVRRFGARGEVQLEFCLGPAGGVERVVVQRSSGVAVLDEAATTCVVPGAVPFPAAASGRCFTVPVQF